MRVKPVVFSVGVAISIVAVLVFSIFGILYFYWGDTTAVKDSLSTIAGFFGGFATLGAAVIAAYLFNDWRDTENYKRSQFLYDNCLSTAYNATTLMDELLIILVKNPNSNPNLIHPLMDKVVHSTFEVIAQVGMDYNESISKDKKLKKIFEIILIINKQFRKYNTQVEVITLQNLEAFSDGINTKLDEMSEPTIGEYSHYFD